jgi:hypothetical protein
MPLCGRAAKDCSLFLRKWEVCPKHILSLSSLGFLLYKFRAGESPKDRPGGYTYCSIKSAVVVLERTSRFTYIKSGGATWNCQPDLLCLGQFGQDFLLRKEDKYVARKTPTKAKVSIAGHSRARNFYNAGTSKAKT